MVRELQFGHSGLLEPNHVGLRRPSLAKSSLAWLIGCLASVAAGLVAMVFVVVFAATLAVVLILAAAFLASGAVAWRLRRARLSVPPILEARKIGHSWVAYGWDQQA